MEDRERKILEEMRNLQRNVKKQYKRKSNVTRVLIVILYVLIAVGIVFLLLSLTGILITGKAQFIKEVTKVYEFVEKEANKREQDPYYQYIGGNYEERNNSFEQSYKDISQLIGEDIDENFYLLDNNIINKKFNVVSNKNGEYNTNAVKQLIGVEELEGIYLVNYNKKLVFNLIPYIEGEEKMYTTQEIIDEYNSSRDVDDSGANEPMLLEGMTPVKYNKELGKWEITTKDDPQWYNYNNKEWANVILSDYEKDISEASMFVWIPRYAYKISEENYNKSKEGIIAIKFLSGNTNKDKTGYIVDTNNTDSSKDYVVHPAFNFKKDLTGIWVSKFEASNSEYGSTGENYGGSDDVSLTYKSLADKYSWMNVNIDTSFRICLNMVNNNNIYGLNSSKADSHLMKNTEWGAVAYLAQSRYGREINKVTINNYFEKNKIKTGYAAISNSSVEYGSDGAKTFLWNTKKGYKASTTGNPYGVYDLVGGAVERTAAYLNNGLQIISEEAMLLSQSDSIYKDIYLVGNSDNRIENYSLAQKKYGDALFETSSKEKERNAWYKANSFMATERYAFFYRGGKSTDGNSAGLFYFMSSSGGLYEYAGFRAVITEK